MDVDGEELILNPKFSLLTSPEMIALRYDNLNS